MRKSNPYYQNHHPVSIETQFFPTGNLYLPVKKRKIKGRWTTEEHAQFIDCLKKYGKDWDKLDEMVPTRDSLQIRSHYQKYFDRIKKDYNTDNPMEFILKGVCDVSPFYKFDKSKLNPSSKKLIEEEKEKPKTNQMIHKFIKSKDLSYSKLEKLPIIAQEETLHKQQTPRTLKKRDLKSKIKYYEECSSSGFFESKAERSHKKSKQHKRRLKRYHKHSRQSMGNKKSIKNKTHHSFNISDKHSEKIDLITKAFKVGKLNSSKGNPSADNHFSNRIMIDSGKMSIGGNSIEMNVPYKMEKAQDGTNSIIPLHPVKIIVEPLLKNPQTNYSCREYSDTNLKRTFPTFRTYCPEKKKFIEEPQVPLPQNLQYKINKGAQIQSMSTSITRAQSSQPQKELYNSLLQMSSLMTNYCTCSYWFQD